ncbi:MAG: hypothetical protein JWM72_298 [Actinomycetia bacterium]|jgi:hypothetical protein|nr:hypothetical protein [Actinomycetes bacterium]
MAEPHYPLGPSLSGLGGGVLPGNVGAVDDHFFRRYRSLLDAEDAAFDELEHAYEDGDRASFESDLAMWHIAIERRTSFLTTHGLSAEPLSI